MLSPGDGIAIAGVCAVAIGAIAKYVPKKSSNGDKKYVMKETCQSNVEAFLRELGRVQRQLDDLNKFLRNGQRQRP